MTDAVNALYDALAYAETGGEPNPWIRTRVRPKGGSTAFGPVQITNTLMQDYLNRKLIKDPANIGFAKEVMTPMYIHFNKYGNEPTKPGYNRQYDYGGTGLLDPMQRDNYKNLANELIGLKYQESNGNLDRFIRSWRGADDTRYAAKVKSKLKGKL